MVVPAAFVGCRPGAAVTVGGVASYLTANDPGPLVLPALSRHVPLAEPVAPSGPENVVEVQDAIPEPPSDPVNVTDTACVYQPFRSGARSTFAPVTAGGVESMLNWRWKGVFWLPQVQSTKELLEVKLAVGRTGRRRRRVDLHLDR